jgi:hypothetical protein
MTIVRNRDMILQACEFRKLVRRIPALISNYGSFDRQGGPDTVSMTDAQALQTVRRHLESLFPKTCSNCHRKFATLREYIVVTQPVGRTISYDAEMGDWDTTSPLGSAALANCSCGTTLALTTAGMALPERQALLNWVRIETQRRGVTASELLERLRDELRRQVLGESTP